MSKYHFYVFISLILFSCDTNSIEILPNLKTYVTGKEIVLDNVVACASNPKEEEDNEVWIFFYPRPGATDFRLFECLCITTNPEEPLDGFISVFDIEHEDVFNSKLGLYKPYARYSSIFIVTYEEGGVVHLSSPIFTNPYESPTDWSMDITQVTTGSLTPSFAWDSIGASNIYFQLIQDNNGDVVSGTYTSELFFNFDDQSNVIFDINEKAPSPLIKDSDYTLTMMAVGPDNWVYGVGEKTFRID